MKFSQKMPLYFFYTMVQKVKNDQKLKSRGPALKKNSVQPNAIPKSSADVTAGQPADVSPIAQLRVEIASLRAVFLRLMI